MKVLWEDGDWKLIIDEKNYTYGRHTYTERDGKRVLKIKNPAYFPTIGGAVRFIVRARADERCTDLKTWLREYDAQIAYFKEYFGEK